MKSWCSIRTATFRKGLPLTFSCCATVCGPLRPSPITYWKESRDGRLCNCCETKWQWRLLNVLSIARKCISLMRHSYAVQAFKSGPLAAWISVRSERERLVSPQPGFGRFTTTSSEDVHQSTGIG